MSDHETAWQTLLTAAMLGTERRPAALPAAGGALPGFLGRLDASHPQHFLMQGAAAAALYRQAGRLPSRVPVNAWPVCETEELARCSPAAAARLTGMLGDKSKDFITEWLALAATSQKRVPEEVLPDVLAWGQHHPDQVNLLLPVLGVRGRWLAAQMPSAEMVAGAVQVENISVQAAAALWQTGRKTVRHQLLRRLRKTDSAQALGLAASTWAEENVEERAAFLAEFSVGLSMADEPFLEGVLDDRSKEVRLAAVELLAQMSGSRLVQRQAERAQALLKWKPGGFLRKPQIEVTLPEDCDKGMLRDGVEPKRPLKALGEKGGWLSQILSAVPPSLWSRQWVKSPSELMEIAGEGDWQELLHEGWSAAAHRHRDPDWTEAILAIYPKRALLLRDLPANRRLAFLTAQIKSRPLEGMELLLSHFDRWGPELTLLCLQHLRDYYLKSHAGSTVKFSRVSLLVPGRFMDPVLSAEAAKKLSHKAADEAEWEQEVEKLLQILDFRRQMMEELR